MRLHQPNGKFYRLPGTAASGNVPSIPMHDTLIGSGELDKTAPAKAAAKPAFSRVNSVDENEFLFIEELLEGGGESIPP